MAKATRRLTERLTEGIPARAAGPSINLAGFGADAPEYEHSAYRGWVLAGVFLAGLAFWVGLGWGIEAWIGG